MFLIFNDGFNNNRQEWVDPRARANYSSPLQSKGTTQFPLNIIWQFGSHHKTQWGRDSYCAGFHYLTIALNRCSMFISSYIERNRFFPLKKPTQNSLTDASSYDFTNIYVIIMKLSFRWSCIGDLNGSNGVKVTIRSSTSSASFIATVVGKWSSCKLLFLCFVFTRLPTHWIESVSSYETHSQTLRPRGGVRMLLSEKWSIPLRLKWCEAPQKTTCRSAENQRLAQRWLQKETTTAQPRLSYSHRPVMHFEEYININKVDVISYSTIHSVYCFVFLAVIRQCSTAEDSSTRFVIYGHSLELTVCVNVANLNNFDWLSRAWKYPIKNNRGHQSLYLQTLGSFCRIYWLNRSLLRSIFTIFMYSLPI